MTRTVLGRFLVVPRKGHELSRRTPQREGTAEWDALLPAELLKRRPSPPPLRRRSRHNHMRYDQLLMRGSRSDAGEAVREVIDQIMDSWRSSIARARQWSWEENTRLTYGCWQVVMSVEFLQHYFAKSGHKDLFYHPTPYLKRGSTTAPFGSREASATRRLRQTGLAVS